MRDCDHLNSPLRHSVLMQPELLSLNLKHLWTCIFSPFQMFQRLRPTPAGLGGQQLPRWGVFGWSDRLGFSHLLIIPDRLSRVADERQDVWHHWHHAPLPCHHRHCRQNHGQDQRGHCGQSPGLHLPPSNQSPHWRYSGTLHPGLRAAVFLKLPVFGLLIFCLGEWI